MTHTTDRDTTEITTEIGDPNQTIGTTRKTKAIKTGMITIKTGTGTTTDRRLNKYQHHRNQPKAQIIFEYTDQNMSEMLRMVRNFIDCMKANPATREQFKTNKLTTRKEYNNEINESEINACNLDQVQQLINEDKDIVFDALVAADYIDEVDCTNGSSHQQA